MAAIERFKTCKRCSHDNAESAVKCNGCGNSLSGIFSDHHFKRWACPQCGRLNMEENSKCMCGHAKSGGGWIIAVIIVVVLVVLANIGGAK
ncbi:hypothetical protein EII18_12675 [Comamonadaceae bacterium OH3737_COT-264]|nr:hypothetical protein EII18_12675 [Comamonadaceae bacterium OH3737_COT-264]